MTKDRLDISAAVVQDEIRRIAQEIAAGSYRPPGDRNRKK